MSSNQTFNPSDPSQALAMLDAILGGDNLNFNRTYHRAIDTAIATLGQVITERDTAIATLGQVITERDTALARVAGLEIELAQLKPAPLPASEDLSTDVAAQAGS